MYSLEYNKLNINSKKSWMISRLITTVIVSSLLLGLDIFLIYVSKFQWAINLSFFIYLATGFFILLLLLNTFLYPFIEYKQWKYLINEDKVDFSEGIFFLTRTVIPIVRIQHIKVHQGPINRSFNLADIEIVTAGGSHKIPNIEFGKAEEISDYLKNKIKTKVEDSNESRNS